MMTDAFPDIAEDGSLISGHGGDEVEPLIRSASQQLPGRLVVQFDFLMPGEATFLTMLETGTYPLGQTNPLVARYIEVFHDNAAAFPADILQAHFQRFLWLRMPRKKPQQSLRIRGLRSKDRAWRWVPGRGKRRTL